jgi:hypothetical protein
MPAQQPTLGQDVLDKLEEVLSEFRDGGRKTRKSLVDRLAKETLPGGADGQTHKKVFS